MNIFPFKAALNASTLFPFKLDVIEQVQVAAEAGYSGIELWVRDIEAYLAAGGTTAALRAATETNGLEIINAIAFFAWADSDSAVREQALVQAEREIRILAEIGCRSVAAPPFGNVAGESLDAIAAAFAHLAGTARGLSVEPLLEFWGRAPRLSRLSEALYIALESGVPNAKLLLDPFHMYTGGSQIADLAYVSGTAIGVVHVNDYPATPGRDQVTDAQRVFPGEGVMPSSDFAVALYQSGYRGYLSLELFIEDFHGQTALDVARHGRQAIERAYAIEKA